MAGSCKHKTKLPVPQISYKKKIHVVCMFQVSLTIRINTIQKL